MSEEAKAWARIEDNFEKLYLHMYWLEQLRVMSYTQSNYLYMFINH